tara:strand:+ start:73 stop:879 length:807 start_codon:yes stop_codon:yes gene_type:complete
MNTNSGESDSAPGSNNRVLEMTSTFLRMEIQRKNMFESVRAAGKMARVDKGAHVLASQNQTYRTLQQQRAYRNTLPNRSPIGLSAVTPLDDFSFSFETDGYNLDTPQAAGGRGQSSSSSSSSSSSNSGNSGGGGGTQWATGGQSSAVMPSKGGEMTPIGGLGSKLQLRKENDSVLRQSIEGLHNMSIESNQFGATKATMPSRNPLPSLALGNASQQFLFDGSLGQMLSPAAEQLAKISMLFKSGNISSEQRSQMKDHLYLSLSQDSLL